MTSCGEGGSDEQQVQQELTTLREEYDRLRKDREKALENNVEAQQLIDNIFTSINSISGRISDLERSHENNVYISNHNKAEEIYKDIAAIRDSLSKAQQSDKIDESTRIIIRNLQAAIEQKQQEINKLKAIIEEQRRQIHTRDNQITSLDNSLSQTNQQLTQSNAELENTRERLRENEMNSWISMGDELMSAAKMLPEVKGHGNMKPIKAAKLQIILKARSCYQNAQSLGSNIASSKISEADRLYRENQ